MAIRKLLLPLTGTAAGEAALATALLDRADLGRPRHRAACARGQPRRRPAGRRGPVGRDDRGNDVGDREGKRRPRPRGARHVRPLRRRARGHGRPRRGRARWAPPRASPRSPGGRRTWSRSRPGSPTSPSCRTRRRARTSPPPTRCTRCCSIPAGPVLIAPHEAPTYDRHAASASPGTAPPSRPPRCWAALPWMQRAEAVRILTAEGYQRRGPARPSSPATSRCTASSARSPPSARSTAMSARACWRRRAIRRRPAGMGAYSHSRLRQLILGGVTRARAGELATCR